MSILKELLLLIEAPEVPVELKAVIAAFPKHHGKALSSLWGGKRLVWHGDRFFDDDKLGPAYEKAEAAAKKFMDDGYNTDCHLELENADGDMHDFSFDVEFGEQHGADHQECYVGYDPKSDKLYIGFDTWVPDETFNQDFDGAFKDMTGDDHDMDDEEHQEVYNKAWKEYNDSNMGFWGLVFEITHNGDEYEAEEAMPPMTGGFYRGMFKLFKQNHPRVIDIRLD